MPYRIRNGEPPAEALPRIAAEQLDRALAELADPALSSYERARQARRRAKRLRALLALYRDPLGATYRREDRWFRARSRLLAPYRDADVAVEALDGLLTLAPDLAEAPALGALRGELVLRRDVLAHEGGLAAHLAELAQDLGAARRRAGGWSVPAGADWGALAGGLRMTYARGRRAMRRALADDSSLLRHAWRRRAKDHWLQARLLASIWPAALQPYGVLVRELVDLLGEEHNLLVLWEAVKRGRAVSASAAGGAERLLGPLILRQQVALLARAWPLGRRLYAERPAALVQRWGAWWALWRQAEG